MESKHTELSFQLDIKRVIGCALLLATVTALAVVWLVEQSIEPHVKQNQFVFADGETIPCDSSYYLVYNETYEDEMFDATLFEMEDIGSHIVEVPFGGKTYELQIVIEDQNAPVITFPQEEGSNLVYRVNGKVQANDLFIVEDASEITIQEITPSLEEIRDGTQEVCVTAQDAYHHTASKCATLNVEIKEYALTSQTYGSVEEIISTYIKKYNLNGTNFGFFYYDDEDKETYVYNGDGVFLAASTIKVPLNMVYYDKIKDSEISKKMQYILLQLDIEGEIDRTINDYRVNDAIPLPYLLEQSIINSDNTATNVLIRNLGTFKQYREAISQYSNAKLPVNFTSENVLTPNYMLDVITYLYEHEDDYSNLIDDMKQANPGMYLRSSSDAFEIAQKYGLYDSVLHVNGIVYTPSPYLVGIYTNNVAQANAMITSLNKDLMDYQLQK